MCIRDRSAFPAFGDFTEYACLLRNISCTTSVENYSLDRQFVYSQDSRRKTSLTSMCFADHLLVTLDSSQTFSVLNIFMLIVLFMHDNVHRRVIVTKNSRRVEHALFPRIRGKVSWGDFFDSRVARRSIHQVANYEVVNKFVQNRGDLVSLTLDCSCVLLLGEMSIGCQIIKWYTNL